MELLDEDDLGDEEEELLLLLLLLEGDDELDDDELLLLRFRGAENGEGLFFCGRWDILKKLLQDSDSGSLAKPLNWRVFFCFLVVMGDLGAECPLGG